MSDDAQIRLRLDPRSRPRPPRRPAQFTQEEVDAAREVLHEVVGPPYMARIRDFIAEGAGEAERERGLARLREADREADEQTDAFVRRMLAAAEAARPRRRVDIVERFGSLGPLVDGCEGMGV